MGTEAYGTGRRSYFFISIMCLLLRFNMCLGSDGLGVDNSLDNIETESSPKPKETSPKSPKLLVFMIDGFRWDYYDIHKTNMNAFDEFLSEGVQVEWVEPVFPSLSYPAWTTIGTGVYAETHGIIGNYMYDQRAEAIFDLNNEESTSRTDWWQNSEPIWTSATRAGKKIFQRFWSRCDVPYQESIPDGECTGYTVAKGINAIEKTLNITLTKLNDFDLLMIYGEHIDNIGHKYGPESSEMAYALKELNRVFKGFLDELMDNYYEIYKELNIVIVSDHGMTGAGPETNVTYVDLKEYIDINDVMKIMDYGPTMAIAPLPRNMEKVYSALKEITGVDVYKRDEIPDEYHYKNNRLVLDLLLVAKPGYFIRGYPTFERYSRERDRVYQKQIPAVDPNVGYYRGVHGYVPSMPDMRGIFFAKGPAFKKGIVHPPIQMVDIYQTFTHVLNVMPEPNNGSWSRVSEMFVSASVTYSIRLGPVFAIFAFVHTISSIFYPSWCHL